MGTQAMWYVRDITGERQRRRVSAGEHFVGESIGPPGVHIAVSGS